VHFPEGLGYRNWEEIAPPKNDLGIDGIGGDSIAEALPVDCPVSAFFAAVSWSEGLPGEESRTRHFPSERGALDFRG